MTKWDVAIANVICYTWLNVSSIIKAYCMDFRGIHHLIELLVSRLYNPAVNLCVADCPTDKGHYSDGNKGIMIK